MPIDASAIPTSGFQCRVQPEKTNAVVRFWFAARVRPSLAVAHPLRIGASRVSAPNHVPLGSFNWYPPGEYGYIPHLSGLAEQSPNLLLASKVVQTRN